jgi:hypothetical protein
LKNLKLTLNYYESSSTHFECATVSQIASEKVA